MSNAVTLFGSKLSMADPNEVMQLVNAEVESATVGGDRCYANFSGKLGQYKLSSADGIRGTDESELWVINPNSFVRGLICWKDGRPEVNVKQSIFDDPAEMDVDKSAHPGGRWNRQLGWDMSSMEYEDEQYQLMLSSTSGVNEAARVIDQFGKRFAAGLAYFPVITCGVTTFQGKDDKGNSVRNYKPVFNIKGWLTAEQLTAFEKDPELDLEELFDQNVSGVVADMPNEQQEEDVPLPPPTRAEAARAEAARAVAPAPARRRGTRKSAGADEAPVKAARPSRRTARRAS